MRGTPKRLSIQTSKHTRPQIALTFPRPHGQGQGDRLNNNNGRGSGSTSSSTLGSVVNRLAHSLPNAYTVLQRHTPTTIYASTVPTATCRV